MTTKRGRVTTGIRIPSALNRELAEVADYLGITKNALISQACREYVDMQQEKRRQKGRSNTAVKKNEKSDEKLLKEGIAGIKRAREKLESLGVGLNITFSGWIRVQQAIDNLEEARAKIVHVIKFDLKKKSQEDKD